MVRKFVAFVSFVSAFSAMGFAEDATEKKITFDEHIKPIFREHCTACHSESDKESDLALDTYAGALAGGSSGEVLAEGNSGSSRLFALVTHAERPFMPPDQDVIAKEQVDLLKTWIEQGMPENSGSKIKRSNNAAAAMLGSVSAGKPEGPPPMPEHLLRQPVTETERSAAISALTASPWAPLIAVGGQSQVSLYHTQTGDLLGVIPFPEGEPQSLTFTRDGKQLLIGGGKHSASGCAVLVDIASGERITKVGDELDTVLAADISPDKSRIAIAGPQKIVRIFDSLSGEVVFEMKKHTDWIFSLRYSPDGVLLASGDRSNGLIVWEADTGRLYSDLVGHKDAVRGLDFRGDSNVLASASLDGTIKLWDMFESKEIKSWTAHGGGVTSVAFANNGLIASSGRDANIKLWNGNGELQKEFKGLGDAALEVALTGDGAQVAGGDWNGKVQLWQAETPEQSRLIAANPPSVEKRLAASQELLAAVQAELNEMKQTTDAALAASAMAEQQLENAKLTANKTASQLTDAEAQKLELTNLITASDAKILDLETALAVARKERENSSTKLQLIQAQVTELTQQTQSSSDTLAAAKTQHEQMLASATEAQSKLSAAESKLVAAQREVDQAVADKAALDAKAAELQKTTSEAERKTQELSEKLAGTVAEQQAQQVNTEKLAQELSELNARLAEMQSKAEALAKLQADAIQSLESKESTANQLKGELEAAQQAALDAKERLNLFESSYRKPE